MSSFYNRMLATATRLITKYGKPITVTVVPVGTYSAATGVNTVTPNSPVNRVAVETSFGQLTTLRGELVQVNDKRIMLDAAGVKPTPNDTITLEAAYSVVSVGNLSPGGKDLYYDVHLRRC